MPSWGSRGNQTAGSGLGGGNIGGRGAAPRGGRDQGGGNQNQGGMSPALMNSKYPGMKGKKTKQYEASLENLAKIGTMIGAGMIGPAGSAVTAGLSAIDSALSGQNPLAGALDPFSGRMADVPAGPAGFAQGADKELIGGKPIQPSKTKPKTAKIPIKGFKLLADAGGTLLGS